VTALLIPVLFLVNDFISESKPSIAEPGKAVPIPAPVVDSHAAKFGRKNMTLRTPERQ
jgi:hypothetical protein